MTNQISWLQDVSLEVLQPGFVHTEGGSRQLQINVTKQNTPLQQSDSTRIDMRIICTIAVDENTATVADISAASLTPKAHYAEKAAEVEESLYLYMRGVLGGLLEMSHYSPPLPEHLEQIK